MKTDQERGSDAWKKCKLSMRASTKTQKKRATRECPVSGARGERQTDSYRAGRTRQTRKSPRPKRRSHKARRRRRRKPPKSQGQTTLTRSGKRTGTTPTNRIKKEAKTKRGSRRPSSWNSSSRSSTLRSAASTRRGCSRTTRTRRMRPSTSAGMFCSTCSLNTCTLRSRSTTGARSTLSTTCCKRGCLCGANQKQARSA